MSLAALLTDPTTGIGEIAAFLDGLDHAGRWAHVSRLGRAQQRALYRRAAGRPIGLDHLVGAAAPLTEVIHDGRNTLAVPPRWRVFQKRFCRLDAVGDRLGGYNEGPTRRLLGPGYFVARPAEAAWREQGDVIIDYAEVPGATPPGWPPVVPNTRGLQRFVFHGTCDLLRGVSAHVCVGAAVKGGRPLDHYFVLCRRT
jgi:hypothetical protein